MTPEPEGLQSYFLPEKILGGSGPEVCVKLLNSCSVQLGRLHFFANVVSISFAVSKVFLNMKKKCFFRDILKY